MEKLYQCNKCGIKEKFPFNFIGEKKCKECDKEYEFLRNICPICKKALYKKYEGFVCKNHLCEIGGFKLGRGWVFLSREKRDGLQFLKDKYGFDLTNYENQKRWLHLKSEMIHEKEKCEICRKSYSLEVHHILPRSSHPELTFDKENLMVLCWSCHKKIHQGDKHAFR